VCTTANMMEAKAIPMINARTTENLVGSIKLKKKEIIIDHQRPEELLSS
jgi:hypothetical protein